MIGNQAKPIDMFHFHIITLSYLGPISGSEAINSPIRMYLLRHVIYSPVLNAKIVYLSSFWVPSEGSQACLYLPAHEGD
jgi:hypothetical protein